MSATISFIAKLDLKKDIHDTFEPGENTDSDFTPDEGSDSDTETPPDVEPEFDLGDTPLVDVDIF